jgi:hypothetical protein
MRAGIEGRSEEPYDRLGVSHVECKQHEVSVYLTTGAQACSSGIENDGQQATEPALTL